MDPSQPIQNVFENNQTLSRIVRFTLAAVIVLALAFAGYYYWDRYVHLGDQSPVEMGINQLEQMVREDPEDPEIRLALAQHYFDIGEHSRALAQTRQVLEVYPDNQGALFISGLAYIQTGQLETGIEQLEEFAALRRDSPMAGADTLLETGLYYLGFSYLELSNPQMAIPALEEALQISPTDADAMYLLGLAYAQVDQNEAAIAQFEHAVIFVPNFAEAYHEMAGIYAKLALPHHVTYARGMEAFSLRDYAQALELLQESAVNLPDFIPVHLGLGLTYEHQGDFEKAQVEFEHVLKIDPGNFNASYALGRIETANGED